MSRGLVVQKAGGVELTLDAYVPREKKADRPAVLWIRGGGFTTGNKEVGPAAEFALELARRGYVCFSMDYRLDGSITSGLEDAVAAFRWISERAASVRAGPAAHRRRGRFRRGHSVSARRLLPPGHRDPPVRGAQHLRLAHPQRVVRRPRAGAHPFTATATKPFPSEPRTPLERGLEGKRIPHRFFPMKNEGHNVLGRYRDDAVLEILSFLYTYHDLAHPRKVEPALVVKPGQSVQGFQG